MKAVVVTPGEAGSGRVADVPQPAVGAGQALVEVDGVGVCGTDVEILEGLYGEAPPGDDYLIIGHENVGRIVQPPVDSDLREGDTVVCIVRRPDPEPCPPCAAGEFDMCTNGTYTERGIKGLHGFMAEYYAESPEYLVRLPEHIAPLGVLLEPLSVVEKGVLQAEAIQRRLVWEPKEAVVTGAGPIGLLATMLLRAHGFHVWTLDIVDAGSPKAQLVEACGATYVDGRQRPLATLAAEVPGIDLIIEATAVPQLVFEAIGAIGPNGVVCLTGVSAGSRKIEVAGAALNLEMVLQNKVVFGTVNANRRYFEAGVNDLGVFERMWPGLTGQLVTSRVPVDDYQRALERDETTIKSVVTFR
jgi:glucose 1-dehydrogenase